MLRLIIIPVMFLYVASSRAQAWPISGFYRITSGGYGEWAEVFGTGYPFSLPDTNESYVELMVDGPSTTIWMAILGADRHTVFSSGAFTFFFTNGLMFPDHIQFGGNIQLPEEPSFNYTLSNSAEGLRIDGVFLGPTGPVYVPTAFAHSNIVAVLVAPVPTPTFSMPRVSATGGIKLSVFNGQPGQTNVIQASTDLVAWTAIGTNVFPSTVCPTCPFIDFEEPAHRPHRYYRSFSLP